MGNPLGRYEVLSKLTQGGMAEVFVARLHGADGFTKQFAIKQLLPELSDDPDLVQMFLDEARIASSLTHPNICQIFELGFANGRHFIAMEYLQGLTLSQLTRAARAAKQSLPFALAASVAARAAEGLAHAHEKKGEDGAPLHIVHRDVSPDNVMLTEDGQVKLLDFGIARATHQSRRTRTGLVRGKVAYMSPEQIRGEPVDGRSDVFSLGVVFWELLAGRRLFGAQSDVNAMYSVLNGGAPARPADSEAPESLWSIAEAALERDLARRLPSAREMWQMLDQASHALGEEVGPPLVARVVRQWAAAPAQAHEAGTQRASPLRPAEPSPLAPARAEADPARPRTRLADAAPLDQGRPRRWPWVAGLGATGAVALGLAIRLATSHAEPAPVAVIANAPTVTPPVEVTQAIAPVTPEPAKQVWSPKPALTRPHRPEPKARSVNRPASPAPALATVPEHGRGRLVLDTNPWTKIYLDGQFLGDTPLDEVRVPAGHLRLRAVNEQLHVDKTIEVDVAPDQIVRLRREW